MGEGTVLADFNLGTVLFLHFKGAGAFGQKVEGTVAEEAVKVPLHLMAGEKLAVFIFKESIGRLHKCSPFVRPDAGMESVFPVKYFFYYET